MRDADIPPEFREFVADVVDEQIAEFRARVVSGYVPTQDEVLNTLDQLAQDRRRMRALVLRQGATVQ